jgi:hypothetical protein
MTTSQRTIPLNRTTDPTDANPCEGTALAL